MAAIVGQVVFAGGWIAGSLLQDAAYSPARHNLSDLGALTARAPWVWLLSQGTAGMLTMAFAFWALRPALETADRGFSIGVWFVAFSLMGFDNLTDPFFRLDCRAADLGCTGAAAMASWSGTIHVIVGTVTALLTVVAPFALARRMRRLTRWRDLVPGALVFGGVFMAATVVYGALNGRYGQGWAQRVLCVLESVGIVVLARRVATIASSTSDEQGEYKH